MTSITFVSSIISIDKFLFHSIRDNRITNFYNTMNSLRNQVQLIGHIGQDLDTKSFDSGMLLAKAPIATNEYYRNNKGEKIQETQWHNIVAWGKTAELMKQMVQKGDELAIKGKLVHRKYEDSTGQLRYISEVVVNEFIKLSAKN